MTKNEAAGASSPVDPYASTPHGVLLPGAGVAVGIDRPVARAHYVYPGGWNGWACPSFTLEEAHKVAAWTMALAVKYPDDTEVVTWDADRGVFTGTDSESTYDVEPDMVDGVALYAIGAYGWTWQLFAD